MWHENILGTIGDTPIVKLNRIGHDLNCTLLAKVEFFNPGGSVKDRIGVAMVEAAEKEGKLRPGGTIIEGTSGNTGAGLALAAIAKGYRCIFTTTDKQSREKVDVLRALGAEVIVCPTNVDPDDPKSYYSVAARLSREIPNSVHVNQYENPANTTAHYDTTGPEIWKQTDGRITHFFSGAGTGGTISGTARFLKEENPEIKIIGVDPYGSVYYKYFHTGEFDESEIYPYITEGVGEDILAGNMNFDMVDDYVRVTDREAMQMTRRLASEEGLFVGGSCGMVVSGALQWLENRDRGSISSDDVAVIVLPDSGFRYLSKIYNDAWMKDLGFLVSHPDVSVKVVLESREDPSRQVVSIGPDALLSDVIEKMTANGISQLPVTQNGDIVGSITENLVLKRLIEKPGAKAEPVGEIMSTPFPVVSRSMSIDDLSRHLEGSSGAVLVKDDNDKYQIITKSDLITALFKLGRTKRT